MVCQRAHDPASRYYAIVASRFLYRVAKLKLLDGEQETLGFGKARGVGENQTQGSA
jgi:hypothetical protein